MTTSIDNLLTATECGRFLGMTQGALAQMRYLGTGPVFLKLSAKSVRYRRSDIDQWLKGTARTQTRPV